MWASPARVRGARGAWWPCLRRWPGSQRSLVSARLHSWSDRARGLGRRLIAGCDFDAVRTDAERCPSARQRSVRRGSTVLTLVLNPGARPVAEVSALPISIPASTLVGGVRYRLQNVGDSAATEIRVDSGRYRRERLMRLPDEPFELHCSRLREASNAGLDFLPRLAEVVGDLGNRHRAGRCQACHSGSDHPSDEFVTRWLGWGGGRQRDRSPHVLRRP